MVNILLFGKLFFGAILFITSVSADSEDDAKPPMYTYSLPWWHPSLEYIAKNRIPGPKNHPPVDSLIQPYIMAHTDEDHDVFDGRNGWIQQPPRYPNDHPNLNNYFVNDPVPPSIPVQAIEWHPDVQSSYNAGKKMPDGHPIVMDLLSLSLPPDHPDVDVMLKDPSQYPLPDWHPNLSILVESKPIPKVDVSSFHPNPDKEYTSGNPLPLNHPSVQNLLKASLPINHPNVDILLKYPLANPIPDWHPSLQDILRYGPAPSFPILTIYAGHPDIEKAFNRGEKLFRGHPQIHGMFKEALTKYVPNGHPNLDQIFASPNDYPLPDWHPSLSEIIQYENSLLKTPGNVFTFLFFAFVLLVSIVQTLKHVLKKMKHKSTKKMIPYDTVSSTEYGLDRMAEIEYLESTPRRRIQGHLVEIDDETIVSKDQIFFDNQAPPNYSPVPRTYLAREKMSTLYHSFWTRLTRTRIPRTQWNTGNLLVCLIYLGMNAAAILVNLSYGFGRAFGSLAAANTIVLIISATRNSVLTLLLNAPFDRVIIYHRFIGRVTILLSCIHLLFYMDRIVDQISRYEYWTGTAALGCGLGIVATTTNWVRRRMFNLFYWVHYLFLGFFVFVYLHTKQARLYLNLAIGFYAMDKVLRLIWTQLPQRTLIFENCGVNTAHVRFRKTLLSKLLGKYSVGQYMFVNFPQLSLTEWHPYSISSGPDDDFVDIHIRNLGDQTKKIVAFSKCCAKENLHAWVRVDGPYGHLGFNYRRYGTLLLVGGGIGITPIMSILKDIYGPNRSTNPHCMKNIQLVWVMPNLSDSMLFMETLKVFQDGSILDGSLPKLNVAIHCTRMEPQETDYSISTNRPDFASVLDVCDEINPGSTMLAFACGPSSMVNQLWDETIVRNKMEKRIDFHHETFEF